MRRCSRCPDQNQTSPPNSKARCLGRPQISVSCLSFIIRNDAPKPRSSVQPVISNLWLARWKFRNRILPVHLKSSLSSQVGKMTPTHRCTSCNLISRLGLGVEICTHRPLSPLHRYEHLVFPQIPGFSCHGPWRFPPVWPPAPGNRNRSFDIEFPGVYSSLV